MADNKIQINNIYNKSYASKNYKIAGITLIALVITIIILIILAGISIAAIKNTQIIDKAKEAKTKTEKATIDEEMKLLESDWQVEKNADNNKNFEEFLKEKQQEGKIENYEIKENKEKSYIIHKNGYMVEFNSNGVISGTIEKTENNLPENSKKILEGTKVKIPKNWKQENQTVYAVSIGNGEEVPVPYGFFYVGGNLETGVIISDNKDDEYNKTIDKTTHKYAINLKGNQFVWVPCKKEEYKKINFGLGNIDGYNVATNQNEFYQIEKYGGFYVGRYEAGVSTLNNETGKFEDSVTFEGGASLYNATYASDNRFIARPKEDKSNLATGNIVEKANSIPYYHADYYTAIEMCKRLYNNNIVQSGLITGTQWDMIMKCLSNKSDYSDMKNTKSWGNHYNIARNNLRGYYTIYGQNSDNSTNGFKKTTGSIGSNGQMYLLTTGSSSEFLKKGLYDISGNLYEITDEVINSSTVVSRGGASFNYAQVPACYRLNRLKADVRWQLGI